MSRPTHEPGAQNGTRVATLSVAGAVQHQLSSSAMVGRTALYALAAAVLAAWARWRPRAEHNTGRRLPHTNSATGRAPAPIVWPPPELTGAATTSSPPRNAASRGRGRKGARAAVVAGLPSGRRDARDRACRTASDRARRKLEEQPVAGVPRVQTGGPRGLQGLMDVVLHPQFDTNRWVYLTYHKPTGGRRRRDDACARNLERRRAGGRAGYLRIRRHRD